MNSSLHLPQKKLPTDKSNAQIIETSVQSIPQEKEEEGVVPASPAIPRFKGLGHSPSSGLPAVWLCVKGPPPSSSHAGNIREEKAAGHQPMLLKPILYSSSSNT